MKFEETLYDKPLHAINAVGLSRYRGRTTSRSTDQE